MQEITASITLVASLASLGYVVGRKIPLLLQFPAKQEGDSAREIFRTENKTSQWLESLRKKAQAKKAAFADDYWEQLKKSKEKKRVSG